MLSLEEGATSSSGKGSNVDKEDENVALVVKGKAKKGPSQGHNSKGGEKNKKDLLKVKCFRCGVFDHYVTQCPKRKKDKKW